MKNLLNTKGTVKLGGDTDRDDLYIAPTIVIDVEPNDVIMGEEVHIL